MIGYSGAYGVGGSGDIDGRVADLDVRAGEAGSVEVSFAHDVLADYGTHVYWLYADGRPAARIAAESPITSPPLADGEHDFDVLIWRQSWGPVPQLITDGVGGRVILRWAAETSSDLAGYRVSYDEGDAAASEFTLLATVDEIAADLRRETAFASGGRLSMTGIFRPEVGVNQAWEVEIVANNQFVLTRGAAVEDARDIVQFVAVEGGLGLVFHDSPASYTATETLSFRVGPRRDFVTDVLADDTYRFEVVGVDRAGNASATPAEVSVVVVNPPDGPSNLTATWSEGDGEITVSWTPTGTFNVYSDFDPGLQIVQPHILSVPIHVVTGVSRVISVPADLGPVRFTVRQVSSGVESENSEIVSVNVRAAEPADLDEPSIVSATATAGGKALVRWRWDPTVGVDVAASFEVYAMGDPVTDPAPGNLLATVTAASAISATASGTVYEYETVSFPSPRWFVVRGKTAGGATSLNSAAFGPVTPDNTAPGNVSGLSGGVI